jgi:hypothetical protein
MLTWIDGTLYPDTDVPDELPTLGDRVDFLARLCSAWDFGLLPDRETVEEIRRPDWLEAVAYLSAWHRHGHGGRPRGTAAGVPPALQPGFFPRP